MFNFVKEFFRVLVKGNVPSLSGFRHYQRWKNLLNKNPLVEKQPWITFNAIDFIAKNARPTDKVFEYGGGGSTLYFLGKVKEVVTVEHNHEWFRMLQNTVSSAESKRWQSQLILPESAADTKKLHKARPADYYSEDPGFSNATFKAYSTAICQFNDETFDWVLIDGRARTSCLFHALPKVKLGGYLLLDNAERKHYLQDNLRLLKQHYKLVDNHMGPVPYSPYFSKTAIWQRIS